MSSRSTSTLWLHARHLGHTLPDGRTPFSDLELVLHHGISALVGRNGAGKSLLARILAGVLPPTQGQVERHGSIAYVAQRATAATGRVADLLGCAPILDALHRIENGSCAAEDFAAVGNDWDLPQRLYQWFSRFGLAHLAPDTAAARLSGGELARLDLIAALWRAPDHLILDEPSNHLDRGARRQLAEFITQWPGGLLLISHDRALLDGVQEIHHLDGLGLHRYGGNYRFYAAARRQEQEALATRIAQGKTALRREQREQRAALERQQQRLARGKRERHTANQAKVLLDRQKERSDHSSGRLAATQAAGVQRQAETLQALEQRREIPIGLRLALPQPQAGGTRTVIAVEGLDFAYAAPLFHNFSLCIMQGERCALRGANGSGKSTLLQLITGALQPRRGKVRLHRPWVLIDQHTSMLDAAQTPLENFRRLAPGLAESDYRHRLARLGLDAACAAVEVQNLSGGERLKTALACALLGPAPTPLLLLDEPTNNLDLDAIAALEAALNDYRGTLLVISHDEHLLQAIGITREISVTSDK
jgi:ATPase components of ABC transporters with duplicated ATPase domains